MDPISTLFAAYITSVTNNFHTEITDIMGTELHAVNIEYKGTQIPFQYQIWRVHDQSVCNSYMNNVGAYSDCTQKAKLLFNDLCDELSKSNKKDWRFIKTRNMYCNAAISYKPTIASISSSVDPSELEIARKKCNELIIQAMGNNDSSIILKRDKACRKYKNLK